MSQALINKYRPTEWDQVVGHGFQVKALRAALGKGSARTFLLTGASGTGKTTLARIAATEVGCKEGDLLEIDAATHTGIDDMREAAASLLYRPLGEGAVKAVIVDECHALSKAAVQSLLKILEEPPPWVYWFLCTTEPGRILTTIRTRCLHLALSPVQTRPLIDLLLSIAKEEKIRNPAIAEIALVCAQKAEGSPRQAIANLSLCFGAKTKEEAQQLLRDGAAPGEAIELARMLARGASWIDIQDILGRLKEAEANPESVRHVVRAYITTLILGAKSEKQAGRGLEILDAFSQPFNSFDGISPLVLACGKATLS